MTRTADSYDLTRAETAVFDLVDPTRRFFSWLVRGLFVLWVVGIAVVGPNVGGHAGRLSQTLMGQEVLVLFGLVLVFGGVLIWYQVADGLDRSKRGGRGPIQLDILKNGLKFTWGSGSPAIWLWKDVQTPPLDRGLYGGEPRI